MRAVAVIAAAILLTACPGNQPEDSAQHSEPRNTRTATNPQAVPENSTAMNPVMPPQKELPGSRAGAAATGTIEVQLTEYGIQMPDTLPPGATRFRIANAGKENHNFVIEGPGVQTKLSSDVMRGDTAEIAVTLQAGTYNVYCPVDGHKGKGMQRSVTVR